MAVAPAVLKLSDDECLGILSAIGLQEDSTLNPVPRSRDKEHRFGIMGGKAITSCDMPMSESST